MEVIAEINDLACRSIELGDYQIALDVLNSCLGCVKQLKRFRGPLSGSSNTIDSAETQKATKESVARLLEGAKQKLLARSRAVTNSNFTVAEKRKRSTATTRPRKRRRRTPQDDQDFHVPSSETGTTSPSSDVDPSRQSACSFSLSHDCMCVPYHSPLQDCNQCLHECQEMEELHFVYRKPLRLTKFQWSRIAECNCGNDREEDQKHKQQMAREVELAISANLIFNIALSHHLIANTTKKEPKRNTRYYPGLSPDSGDDTDDDDDENGYDSCCDDLADSLQTKQRLKGALRLYELGFRVHTKRVSFVMSRRRHVHSRPSLPSVSLSLPSSISIPRQVSLLPQDDDASTPSQEGDREDELKSATRFALALLNNCAQIHEALGQNDKAQIFQKRLLSFLLVIVDSGESIHDIIGDDPAVDGYLKNVLAGTVFDRKTAPAAMA